MDRMVRSSAGFPKVFRPPVYPETWDYSGVGLSVKSTLIELLIRDP